MVDNDSYTRWQNTPIARISKIPAPARILSCVLFNLNLINEARKHKKPHKTKLRGFFELSKVKLHPASASVPLVNTNTSLKKNGIGTSRTLSLA